MVKVVEMARNVVLTATHSIQNKTHSATTVKATTAPSMGKKEKAANHNTCSSWQQAERVLAPDEDYEPSSSSPAAEGAYVCASVSGREK